MTTLALAILTVGIFAVQVWAKSKGLKPTGFFFHAPAIAFIAFISTIISAFV